MNRTMSGAKVAIKSIDSPGWLHSGPGSIPNLELEPAVGLARGGGAALSAACLAISVDKFSGNG